MRIGFATVLCPKDRKSELTLGSLSPDLSAYICEDCKGTWIPSDHYEEWQVKLGEHPHPDPSQCRAVLNVDFVQSPYDTRAALCPSCQSYLSRAKVNLNVGFYVERCPNCGGIWCDRGEWDILQKLGWHTTIQTLFTQEWQSRVRKYELEEQERQAMIDKLGQELADRIFEMAAVLEKHPNGDFAVAYLMRRFEQ